MRLIKQLASCCVKAKQIMDEVIANYVTALLAKTQTAAIDDI